MEKKEDYPCMDCAGTGKLENFYGSNNSTRTCTTCKGTGRVKRN